MKAELFDKWLTDLRTTDTPQGKGHLRSTDGDCCLGRLCEVSGVGRWVEVSFNGVTEYDVDGAYLTTDLMGEDVDLCERLGLPESVMHDCIDYNDTERFSFPEIADQLEERREEIVGFEYELGVQEDL